jgi:tRNA A37 threonylcarbamoyladenosine synthetase subunit TsaC/SUA5/YrdC
MSILDIKGDARRIFDVLKNGGIAIAPNDVGYGMSGGSKEALQRIFKTKKRGAHKRNAMLCDIVTQREVHVVNRRAQDMIEAITQDYDLPLGAIAPFNPEHPLIRKHDEETIKASTAKGTLGMLLNAGPLYEEICRLSREEVHPIFGSSANLTGTGTKFRLEDVQPELRAIADIELDYGLRRYHYYQRSATILKFTGDGVECLRIGSCYELIVDVLKRHFGVDLPEDPGRDVSPSGHLQEFALKDAD